MNRVYFVLLGLVLLISGCQNTKELESQREQIESLSVENERLNNELESVKKDRDHTKQKLDEYEAAINAMEEEKEDVTVTVIKSKIDINPNDGIEDLYYEFWPMTCYVRNNTDKDIQSIQGKIKVIDMFGTEIFTMACDFTDQTIPANESATFNMTLQLDEFINEKVKYYVTADLKFKYEVKSIVFTDGTTKN